MYVMCIVVLNTRYNCFVYYVIWLYVLLIILMITINFSYNKIQVYFLRTRNRSEFQQIQN